MVDLNCDRLKTYLRSFYHNIMYVVYFFITFWIIQSWCHMINPKFMMSIHVNIRVKVQGCISITMVSWSLRLPHITSGHSLNQRNCNGSYANVSWSSGLYHNHVIKTGGTRVSMQLKVTASYIIIQLHHTVTVVVFTSLLITRLPLCFQSAAAADLVTELPSSTPRSSLPPIVSTFSLLCSNQCVKIT